MVRKYLPWVNLLACAICLILILVDAIWPDLLLFNEKPAKTAALVACLITAANAMLLISRYRAVLRRRRNGRFSGARR